MHWTFFIDISLYVGRMMCALNRFTDINIFLGLYWLPFEGSDVSCMIRLESSNTSDKSVKERQDPSAIFSSPRHSPSESKGEPLWRYQMLFREEIEGPEPRHIFEPTDFAMLRPIPEIIQFMTSE